MFLVFHWSSPVALGDEGPGFSPSEAEAVVVSVVVLSVAPLVVDDWWLTGGGVGLMLAVAALSLLVLVLALLEDSIGSDIFGILDGRGPSGSMKKRSGWSENLVSNLEKEVGFGFLIDGHNLSKIDRVRSRLVIAEVLVLKKR